MLIREWMSAKVITASIDTSMLKISRQLKDAGIRRIPIVDENNFVLGLVSDKDIKEASPSKATTLDVHEIHYLLSEITAKDVMTANPTCVYDDETIEQVAVTMQEKNLTGVPVISREKKIVGMITAQDIFKILVEITGVKKGGIQLALSLSDEPGSLQPTLSLIRENGGRITSILTGKEADEGDMRDVYIRLRPCEQETQDKIIDVLTQVKELQYYVTDKVYHVREK